MSNLNFDVFQAPEIRDLLKTKAHLLRAGLPADHVVIETFSQIVAVYRRRVGLATYLSQMLDNLANVPVGECTLYTAENERIDCDSYGDKIQPIQKFLGRFRGRLPFKIIAKGQEKYL